MLTPGGPLAPTGGAMRGAKTDGRRAPSSPSPTPDENSQVRARAEESQAYHLDRILGRKPKSDSHRRE